jgi:hypothetical protein
MLFWPVNRMSLRPGLMWLTLNLALIIWGLLRSKFSFRFHILRKMFPFSHRGVWVPQVEDHCSVPPVRLCIPWWWVVEHNRKNDISWWDTQARRRDTPWNLKVRIRSTGIFINNLKHLMISTIWSKHLVRREKLLKVKVLLEGRVAR